MRIPGLSFISRRISKLLQIESDEDAHNITRELQRRALSDTADYVQSRMSMVPAVSSKFELLDLAMKKVTVDGLCLEFGVWRGATINHVAAQLAKPVYGFDSFEGLPEDWNGLVPKGHFKLTTVPKVRQNVELVVGWFDTTLQSFLAAHSGPVAFCHVDCDLYSSTKTIFQNIGPRIVNGTVIVFDEYFNYPGWRDGEFRAFQEFCTEAGVTYEYVGYCRTAEQVAVRILSIRQSS